MTTEDKSILWKSPQEILEYGKKSIGKETKPVKGRYPVEHDIIRRFCHMMDDTNPLYLDPEYAKKAGYRDVVCPPLLVGYLAGAGIWPPTTQDAPRLSALPHASKETPRQSINAATEWEFLKPVIVGDHLSSKNRIGDVYIKGIRRDPEAIWVVTEQIISNQNGEVVAVMRNSNVSWKK